MAVGRICDEMRRVGRNRGGECAAIEGGPCDVTQEPSRHRQKIALMLNQEIESNDCVGRFPSERQKREGKGGEGRGGEGGKGPKENGKERKVGKRKRKEKRERERNEEGTSFTMLRTATTRKRFHFWPWLNDTSRIIHRGSFGCEFPVSRTTVQATPTTPEPHTHTHTHTHTYIQID